ncbi:DUF438 domain-containing protein [Sunxiuqinia sp. A32]|uniref:DUF438 domain-containing protein n=1 Tax=Sunxiuqinia sp. A32 TaxID=3461496 RepID=UPI0040451FCF
MSEFTNTKEKRLVKLLQLAKIILGTGNPRSFVVTNKEFINTVIPSDFIALFDELIKQKHPIENLKALSNKILNIFHLPIERHERVEPKTGSFLWFLEQNNLEMAKVLNEIRPVFKAFIREPNSIDIKKQLLTLISELEIFVKHYTIKENLLFPVIEKSWQDFRCVQIMWSFHDDIRKNIRIVKEQLSNNSIDLKQFNRCVGDIFFNMLAIKFREERILFPYILSTISEDQLDVLKNEGADLGYPYIHPPESNPKEERDEFQNGLANLGTGELSVEQIKLIFNHLPVDITFVDENDKVRYFSTPKKRIFPRTTAIIGREVKNCHPPESVHVVEKIVQSFRSGEKDKASFWIEVKGEFILIQYFALRDENGKYRGVIEVSQEVSEIKALEGEKRLLDW